MFGVTTGLTLIIFDVAVPHGDVTTALKYEFAFTVQY
jgi:hypothetical protein